MSTAKKVTIVLEADDALLLQAHLRHDRYIFDQAGNEVMTGMLDRIEAELNRATKEPEKTVWTELMEPDHERS